MNPDQAEQEPGDLHSADTARTPSTISTSNEDEKDIPGRTRRPRLLGNRRVATARRSMTEAHRLQRSIAQSVSSQALHIFLYNTVIHFPRSSASKGHFTSLMTLGQSSSKLEALPFALEAVALASLAQRFSHSEAKLLAMRRYHVAIRLLRDADIDSESNVLSVIACILLLGNYEIINANNTSSFNWVQHLHGLTTVMNTYIGCNQLPASGIPMLVLGSRTPSDICGTNDPLRDYLNSTVRQTTLAPFDNLCSILTRVQHLFAEANTVFDPDSVRYESVLRQYREQTTKLKFELLAWGLAQSEGAQHKTIQHFTQPYMLRFPGIEDLACPSTRAVSYHDYSIASMWMTYHQCHLHLINLLTRINHTLSSNPEAYLQGREYARLRNECSNFVDDVFASIPFMFVGESIHGTKPKLSIWLQARPPMLIGGLNLQWILFTISILNIVPTSSRQNAKALLLWIGKNLGIGQATVLAHTDKNPPGGVTAKGNALTWAGFLV